MTNTIVWPPIYQLKRHRRARRVKLHASPLYGLQITVPTRFSLKHLPAILEENKDWIIAKVGNFSKENITLPETLTLHALNETWTIEYVQDEKLRLKAKFPNIVITGDLTKPELIQQKILSWIKKIAAPFLQIRIDEISQQTGLTYQNLSVRKQKTLWGSCTADKNISLNLKLIFLPKELMDYIIIHELCHTKCLNHSATFWKWVELHDPQYREHRSKMRQADQFIPLSLI